MTGDDEIHIASPHYLTHKKQTRSAIYLFVLYMRRRRKKSSCLRKGGTKEEQESEIK